MTKAFDAFAKVNLYLHVCGKRDDGYHELDSLIVFAKTGDRIFVEPAEDISLTLSGPLGSLLKNEPDNLVLCAARKLQALCNVKTGASITLEKNLPIAAGIGGGSGDAAATLQALCDLWKVSPAKEELDALALELGADVPICLEGRAAHVGGIGEIITPVQQVPACWMVLVNPMEAVSTPAVFKARSGRFTPANPMTGKYDFESFIKQLEIRHNDLMKPAVEIAPIVDDVLKALATQQNCKISRMSGSGATCFGLFKEKSDAERAVKNIKNQYVKWWASAAEIVL